MSFAEAIRELAEQSGLQLSILDRDNFVCDFTLADGRTHKVIISEGGKVGGFGMVTVQAVTAMGAFDLPSDVQYRVLAYNHSAPIGQFGAIMSEGCVILSLVQYLPLGDLIPSVFETVTRAIAQTADRFEFEITGRDDL